MDTKTQLIVEATETHPCHPENRTAAAARSRTKHGLYSQHAVIPGEDPVAFRALRDEMFRDLQPICPEEAKTAAQMVMVQWQLERLWATQTGVFEEYERVRPPQGGESHPLRLAQCFLDDCANERSFDKLSLQQQRLINLFHKCGRRFDTMREQHRKGQSRAKDRYEAQEQVSYEVAVAPDPAPAEMSASPSSDATSGEIADREPRVAPARPASTEPEPQPGIPVAEHAAPEAAPRAQEEASQATGHLNEAPAILANAGFLFVEATSSSDEGSAEIADRQPLLAPAGPSSPAGRGGKTSDLECQQNETAQEQASSDSTHCLQGEVARRAGVGLTDPAATPSSDEGSAEIADRREPGPEILQPGPDVAPRPALRPARRHDPFAVVGPSDSELGRRRAQRWREEREGAHRKFVQAVASLP